MAIIEECKPRGMFGNGTDNVGFLINNVYTCLHARGDRD